MSGLNIHQGGSNALGIASLIYKLLQPNSLPNSLPKSDLDVSPGQMATPQGAVSLPSTIANMLIGGGQGGGDIQQPQQQVQQPKSLLAAGSKNCPDPNGVHGPGTPMTLTSMYGIPMYMCPVCGYSERAGG
jgi:hypothetical protein